MTAQKEQAENKKEGKNTLKKKKKQGKKMWGWSRSKAKSVGTIFAR